MASYECEITSAVLRAEWVLGTSRVPACVGRIRACVRACVCAGYLRSALDAQGTNPLNPQVDHVHALAGDLHGAALEALLVVHVHLVGAEKRRREQSQTGGQLKVKGSARGALRPR